MAPKFSTSPITISVNTTCEVTVHEGTTTFDSRLIALLEKFDVLHPLTTPAPDITGTDVDSNRTSSSRHDRMSWHSTLTTRSWATSSISPFLTSPRMNRLELLPFPLLPAVTGDSDDNSRTYRNSLATSISTLPPSTPQNSFTSSPHIVSSTSPETYLGTQYQYRYDDIAILHPTTPWHIHQKAFSLPAPVRCEIATGRCTSHRGLRRAQTIHRKKSSCNLRDDFLNSVASSGELA